MLRLAFIFLLAGVFIHSVLSPINAESDPPKGWLSLEAGLDIGTFESPQKSIVGDSTIHILRINPENFKFRLLTARSKKQGKRLSAKKWAETKNMVATINASMYQADKMTSVSYMRTKGQVNNTWVSKDQTLLAFDPTTPSVPAIQIIDRECQDFKKIRKLYETLVQSIRMVSCHGENVWKQQSKEWSTAAIGIDSQGRVLFIHARSPYTTHDLISTLLKLPIELKQAMYVEGGPKAQLYINTGQQEFEFLGSYSTGSFEHDENDVAWPLPNVLGIQRTIVNSEK